MAKVTYAPIVSDVRGRFGGMVFTQWQGVAAMRRFVPPSQPRTTGQVSHRNLFRALTGLYTRANNTRFQQSWARRAQGQPGIGRNFYLGDNVRLVGGESDTAKLEPYYGLTILPQAASLSVTPGTDQLVVAWTAPTGVAPSGYTLAGYVGYAMRDQDLHDASPEYEQHFISEDDSTLTDTITGLESGEDYRVWIAPYYTVSGGEGINAEAIGTLRNVTGTPT